MLALPYGHVPYLRDQGLRATVLAPLPMPAPRDLPIIDAGRPPSSRPATAAQPGGGLFQVTRARRSQTAALSPASYVRSAGGSPKPGGILRVPCASQPRRESFA